MASCELETLYWSSLEQLVRGRKTDAKPVRFSADVLPVPQARMTTDKIICKKWDALYCYSTGVTKVERLHVFADHTSFQLLGLWILSMLFHAEPVRSTLDLKHEGSVIKHLVCDYKHGGEFWGQDVFGYSAMPSHFLYHESELRRHPWTGVSKHLLPAFLLNNEDDSVITDEQYENRDTLVGFGRDRCADRFAALLLDIGARDNAEVEVDLEGELGFRGVAPGSQEIYLTTPGTQRWIMIGPDYPEFGRREVLPPKDA